MSDHSYVDGKFYEIPLSELVPSVDQPRKFFCPEAHEDLKTSIRENQMLEAILFTVNDGTLVIVSGERRWRALKELGLESVTGRYVATPMPALPIIANLQREDLLPIEKSEALLVLRNQHGYDHEKLAATIGKSVSTVSEVLKLNRLPEEIKEECRKSKRYVYSRLLQIAGARNERTMFSQFKAYKAELDGTIKKKRIAKVNDYSRITTRIDGIIKDFQKVAQETDNCEILVSLFTKIDQLKEIVQKKINKIEQLAVSEFRSAFDKEENSFTTLTADSLETTSSNENHPIPWAEAPEESVQIPENTVFEEADV